MSGVNVEKIEELIKKNNLEVTNLKTDMMNLQGAIKDIVLCYAGKDIEFLFEPIISEVNNLQKLPKIFESYSNTLYNVEIAYKNQDLTSKLIINHINSKNN